MIHTIIAKKDLHNKGRCFTKGKHYTVSAPVTTLPGLMDRMVINDLGEPHTIGNWWREFEEADPENETNEG